MKFSISPTKKLVVLLSLTFPVCFASQKAAAQLQAELVVQQGQAKLASVAFSPDGKQILTAGDNIAVLWDIATGFEVRAFYGHSDLVTSAIFAPSGKEIVTGSDDHTIRIWDVASGREIRQINVDDAVESVSYSHDGTTIAAGTRSADILLWDAASGRPGITIKPAEATGPIGTTLQDIAVSFSPRGNELLGAWHNTAQVWDARTGKEIRRFIGHTYPIRSVSYSSDGRTVLTGGDDKTARLWDVATGAELRRYEVGENVVAVAYSPNDQRIVTGSESGKVIVWDESTGQQVMSLPKKSVATPAAMDTTGKSQEEIMAAALAEIRSVRDRSLQQMIDQPVEGLGGMTYSPDGRLFAVAARYKTFDKGLYLFDGQTGDMERTFKGSAEEHLPDGAQLSVSTDGMQLWTYGPVHWNMKDGIPDLPLGTLHERTPAAISHDGTKLIMAIGSDLNAGLILADAASHKVLFHFVPNEGPPQKVTVFGQRSNQPSFPLKSIRSMVVSPDDTRLLTIGPEVGNPNLTDEVRLWDITTGREICQATLDALDFWQHSSSGHSVAFSPDGRTFLQAGQDRQLHLRSTANCSNLATLPLRVETEKTGNPGDWKVIRQNYYSREDPLDVAFTPDGGHFIVSTENGTLRMVDVASRQTLWKHEGANGLQINAVLFMEAGRRIITSSENHMIVLDAATGHELYRGEDVFPPVNGLVDGVAGKYVVSSHEDGTFRFWSLDSDKMHQLATLFLDSDGHWTVADSVGRFDSDSLDDNSTLHWIMSNERLQPLPLEMFMRQYYTPKLLLKLLTNAELSPLPNITQLRRIQPQVVLKSAAPSKSQQGRVDLVIHAQHTADARQGSSGLQDLRVFRNGQLISYTKGPLHDGDFQVSGVQMPKGRTNATFTAYAFSSDLIKSTTASLTYEYKSSSAPSRRAFLLQIGENHYTAQACELQFAVNDAQQLGRVLTETLKKKGFEVDAEQLISVGTKPGATKEDIRQQLQTIAAHATPDDLFIVSFSGHGYTTPDGQFYILPSDVKGSCQQVDSPFLKGAISSDELSDWLRPIDTGETVFILDSCYSANSVEAHGFKPGPMGSQGLGQLAYDKRIRILAASQSDQTAGEDVRIGQGILSYVLSQKGLIEGKADWSPLDGKITLGEWLRFAVHEVPMLNLTNAGAHDKAKGSRGVRIESTVDAGKSLDARIQTPAVFDFAKQDELVLAEVPKSPLPTTRLGSSTDGNPLLGSYTDDLHGQIVAVNAKVSISPLVPVMPRPTPPKLNVAPPSNARIVTLTKQSPSAQFDAQITAPGDQKHDYNVIYIDARDFSGGATLSVNIMNDRRSNTIGSFDLFPPDTKFTPKGGSQPPLVGAYNVPPGSPAKLWYRFNGGQFFVLGVEGNWGSPAGKHGTVTVNVSVP
jgi:WD40 repeat protein